MNLKLPIAALAAFSLSTSAFAIEAKNCVTETEAAAIFAAVMPDMIDGLRDKCATNLPADAYLVRNADTLVARYKVLADQRWPAAKLAFGKIAGEEEMTKTMPDQFLRPLIGSMIGSELFKDVKPKECVGASKIVESLAPLPAENMSMLISAVLAMVGDENSKDTMPICKGSAG
jgi:hypothetical protein